MNNQNKQREDIAIILDEIIDILFKVKFIVLVLIIFGIVHILTLRDISRLEKSDKCFEKLLVKNYDINYEIDKINTFMSECMSLKD